MLSPVNLTIVFFVLFLFACIFAVTPRLRTLSNFLFMIGCVVLAIIPGMRDFSWPDTENYLFSYVYRIPKLAEYTPGMDVVHYEDEGFILLSSLSKSLGFAPHAYFLFVSAVTMVVLYTDLKKYCIVPLMGLMVYIARFYIGRNMIQIRAALAIAIFVYSLKYVRERKLGKYLLTFVLAALMHHSVLFGFPLYWFKRLRINNRIMVVLITISFLLGGVFSAYVSSLVRGISVENDIGTSYTGGTMAYTVGSGLANPMIYFQLIILAWFALAEKRIHRLTPYYQIFRDGYLYSTCILIALSPFLVLSARISTITATFEIFMIPLLGQSMPRRWHTIAYLAIAVMVSAFAFLQLMKYRYYLTQFTPIL